MKKIKILTIWLLSLWLLGNIFSVADAQGKQNPNYTELNRQINEAGKKAYEEIRNKQANDFQKTIGDISKAQNDKANAIMLKEARRTKCNGIKLNTNFPFVGSCIGFEWGKTNQINVFPKMIKSLMKLIISVIMLMSLIIIIIAGVMVTSSGYDSGNYKKGLDLINKVATGLALLGASGVILKLINPNFFT